METFPPFVHTNMRWKVSISKIKEDSCLTQKNSAGLGVRGEFGGCKRTANEFLGASSCWYDGPDGVIDAS